jgi:hypothetical protein
MSSTFVSFAPSTVAPFTFQPTMAGVQYQVTVPWNAYGERYYISVADFSGNVLVFRPMTSSGPSLQATFAWSNNIATVVTALVHNVPIGSVANAIVTGTGAFDGAWRVLSTGATTLSYPLPTPATSSSGTVDFGLNLIGGYLPGYLVFHEDTQQFEFG